MKLWARNKSRPVPPIPGELLELSRCVSPPEGSESILCLLAGDCPPESVEDDGFLDSQSTMIGVREEPVRFRSEPQEVLNHPVDGILRIGLPAPANPGLGAFSLLPQVVGDAGREIA